MEKILFLAPVLPSDVIATAGILEQAHLLEKLSTRSVPGRIVTAILRTIPRLSRLSRRPSASVHRSLVRTNVLSDFIERITFLLTHSRVRAVDASFEWLDRRSQRMVHPALGGVLAREDCCQHTFRRAKQLGVKTIYQLPTAYWRQVQLLMNRELEEFPCICRAAVDKHEFGPKRTERKDVELELADQVLCPSTFVRESVSRHSTKRPVFIPFGTDSNVSEPARRSRKKVFLYAGNITMRKGVHRLLIAWKKIKAYRTHELRLVGDMFLSQTFLNEFRGMFVHVPRVSREELDQHYNQASALLFNPVADGFGQVILEAMGHGVPVIASRNCGAPDVMKHQSEGLLVDYGADEQLGSAIDWALAHPSELSEMGHQARRKAESWNWSDYATQFLNWLRTCIANQSSV